MKYKKIAIMGAMEEEIQPILSKIEIINTKEYAGNIFYECKFNKRHKEYK